MQLTSKPRQLPPEGTHTAILFQIIDLGTQKTEYQGQVKIGRQLRFAWELCEELMDDGRPYAISKKYTASSHPKSNIVKDIKAWTGKAVDNGFDPTTLIGSACNLTISHDPGGDGTVYANVAAIAPLKKSEKAPPMRNNPLVFDLDNYDPALFEKLPDFLKEIIAESPEYLEATGAGNTASKPAAHLDDEIPF